MTSEEDDDERKTKTNKNRTRIQYDPLNDELDNDRDDDEDILQLTSNKDEEENLAATIEEDYKDLLVQDEMDSEDERFIADDDEEDSVLGSEDDDFEEEEQDYGSSEEDDISDDEEGDDDDDYRGREGVKVVDDEEEEEDELVSLSEDEAEGLGESEKRQKLSEKKKKLILKPTVPLSSRRRVTRSLTEREPNKNKINNGIKVFTVPGQDFESFDDVERTVRRLNASFTTIYNKYRTGNFSIDSIRGFEELKLKTIRRAVDVYLVHRQFEPYKKDTLARSVDYLNRFQVLDKHIQKAYISTDDGNLKDVLQWLKKNQVQDQHILQRHGSKTKLIDIHHSDYESILFVHIFALIQIGILQPQEGWLQCFHEDYVSNL
jgi:hypothetical protein